MSDLETAARPYSKAIYELASEQKNLPFWSDVLQLASQVATEDEMQVLITSPSVNGSDLAELFTTVMSSVADAPEMNQQVKNMLLLLVENDRLLSLPAIYEGYEALKQAAEGSIEVKVTSARKLTVKQEKEMASQLKEKLGKDVSISAEIDQSLIAGAIIRAGDLVIDGSALGRLSKLTSILNK
ncbi:MAG: F0F1 ATP synthase subunit delta [Gammaproteobacteria bacterium]|nr:F0F1 ATP synthase subunit delta [Gammaproteobacteria bacterium]